MSSSFQFAKDITGATSQALPFNTDTVMVSFNNDSSWNAKYVDVPYEHEEYIVEIDAIPLQNLTIGIPNPVVGIECINKNNPPIISQGYTFYNGKKIFKRVSRDSQLKVWLPRTSASGGLDSSTAVLFTFYSI